MSEPIKWPTGPLDREEREALLYLSKSESGQVPWTDVERYEATVRAVEAERDRLRGALGRYGKHDNYYCATGRCRCGLTDALTDPKRSVKDET